MLVACWLYFDRFVNPFVRYDLPEGVHRLPSVLPLTVRQIESGVVQGWHSGAQVFVSLRGVDVADEGVGDDGNGEPLVADHLMPWMSCSKPVSAVAIAMLWERGLVDIDDPVCRHLPEFAVEGKERVTIRHILTHTAGIRGIDILTPAIPWDDAIQKICRMRIEPGWVPGRKAGYSLSSSWFLLAEIVRRIDGRPYDRFVRESIFEPLGMRDSWIGMPADRAASYEKRIAKIYKRDAAPPEPTNWHTAERLTWVAPGSGGRGPMRDMGRFYLALLGGGQLDSVRILSPPTVCALTARHRVGMLDHTFQHTLDWGLGFSVNSNPYGIETVPYGFGRRCAPRTFGHGGFQCCATFADPENELVVAIAFNGLPGERQHSQRIREVATAVDDDLGIG